MLKYLCFFCLVFFAKIQAQVINYVNNGGFETVLSQAGTFEGAKFWGPIDTTKSSYVLENTINSVGSTGFQEPRTGNYYILSQFYCDDCSVSTEREYPRNHLKQVLKPNTTYCAKYYVVNTNNNRIGIDSYGMYLGNSSLDTIMQCESPITYVTPQVENATGDVITDTLQWTPITGTFVAVGNEKYLVLGNFKSNPATNTVLLNPPLWPMSNDVYIDDVSLIEFDLPAFACAVTNTYVIPGDSVFLGREPDVGIDEDCMWYKLPNTTTAIDTVAGFWAKPVVTTTYVVRQDICGNVKWDTVVVSASALGLKDLTLANEDLKLYPIPAKEELTLQWSLDGHEKEFTKGEILNSLGQSVLETDLNYSNKSATINIKELQDGVYALRLLGANSEYISRRFIKK